MLIGAHINSDPRYLVTSTKRIFETGGSLVQIFINPQSIRSKEYIAFKSFIKDNDMKFVVHASYTINLAKQWDEYSPWINQFIDEIRGAYDLGAEAIVVHMGKLLELEKEEAYNNMYSSLLYIHNETIASPIRILLETSTGQGSEICYRIEDYAYFYKKLSRNKNKSISDRFGLCVDTCHIFAAGYDLRSKSTIYQYFEAFEELIGLRHIRLVHLNDSLKDLGSNVDRHENLGKGYIGLEGLMEIVRYLKNIGIPIVLETPAEHLIDDLVMITNDQTMIK
jgi:deoxyribonuclease-4